MTKITVYHFEVWDSANDQMVRSKRMGTPDAIKNTAHGREVGQGIDVDVADVGTEIAGSVTMFDLGRIPRESFRFGTSVTMSVRPLYA